MRTLPVVALLLGLSVAPAAGAQHRWTPVGTTPAGSPVSIDARSIKRTGSRVSATMRVIFKPVVQTPTGPWASSQTKATFDCAKRSSAASESIYFADERGTKVTERRVNKMPGYGPVLKGSPGELALAWLCKG